MKPHTVGVIGAQGHFGQSLCRRLEGAAKILPSTDKTSNKEIAKKSDVVVIAVRPDQVEGVLQEIATHLKLDACVVSFAARYPLSSIEKIVQKPSARGMGDPDGNLLAYFCGKGISMQGIESSLPGLSRTKPLELRSDAEVNIYSVLLSHSLAVIQLEKLNRIDNADEHFEFLAREFSKFGREVRVEEFREYEFENIPEDALKEFATPGGITAKILVELQNPDANPEAVHKKVMSDVFA